MRAAVLPPSPEWVIGASEKPWATIERSVTVTSKRLKWRAPSLSGITREAARAPSGDSQTINGSAPREMLLPPCQRSQPDEPTATMSSGSQRSAASTSPRPML